MRILPKEIAHEVESIKPSGLLCSLVHCREDVHLKSFRVWSPWEAAHGGVVWLNKAVPTRDDVVDMLLPHFYLIIQ